MKSTLFNMVAVLFTITLIASAGVGAVNMITAEPIAAAKALATKQAVSNVVPEFESEQISEQTIDDMPIKEIFTKLGYDPIVLGIKKMEGFVYHLRKEKLTNERHF